MVGSGAPGTPSVSPGLCECSGVSRILKLGAVRRLRQNPVTPNLIDRRVEQFRFDSVQSRHICGLRSLHPTRRLDRFPFYRSIC